MHYASSDANNTYTLIYLSYESSSLKRPIAKGFRFLTGIDVVIDYTGRGHLQVFIPNFYKIS